MNEPRIDIIQLNIQLQSLKHSLNAYIDRFTVDRKDAIDIKKKYNAIFDHHINSNKMTQLNAYKRTKDIILQDLSQQSLLLSNSKDTIINKLKEAQKCMKSLQRQQINQFDTFEQKKKDIEKTQIELDDAIDREQLNQDALKEIKSDQQSLETEISEIKKRQDILKKQIETDKTTHKKLGIELKLDEIKNKAFNIKASNESDDKKLIDLKELIAQIPKETGELQKKEKELTDITKEFNDKNSEFDKIKKQYDILLGEKGELSKSIYAHQKELVESKEKIEKDNTTKLRMDSEIQALQSKLQTLTNELNIKSDDSAKLISTIEQLNNDQTELQKEQTELQKQFLDLEKLQSTYNTQKELIDGNIVQIEKDQIQLSNNIFDVYSKGDEKPGINDYNIVTQLYNLGQKIEKLKKQKEEEDVKQSQNKQSLETQTTEHNRLSDLLEEKKRKYELDKKQIDKQVADANKEIIIRQGIDKEIFDAEQIVSEQTKELEGLTGAIKQYQDDISTFDKQVLKDSQDRAEKEIIHAEKILEEKKGQFEKITQSIGDKKKEIAAQKTVLEEQKLGYDLQQEIIKSHNEQLAKTKQSLTEYDKIIEDLNKEINKSNQELFEITDKFNAIEKQSKIDDEIFQEQEKVNKTNQGIVKENNKKIKDLKPQKRNKQTELDDIKEKIRKQLEQFDIITGQLVSKNAQQKAIKNEQLMLEKLIKDTGPVLTKLQSEIGTLTENSLQLDAEYDKLMLKYIEIQQKITDYNTNISNQLQSVIQSKKVLFNISKDLRKAMDRIVNESKTGLNLLENTKDNHIQKYPAINAAGDEYLKDKIDIEWFKDKGDDVGEEFLYFLSSTLFNNYYFLAKHMHVFQNNLMQLDSEIKQIEALSNIPVIKRSDIIVKQMIPLSQNRNQKQQQEFELQQKNKEQKQQDRKSRNVDITRIQDDFKQKLTDLMIIKDDIIDQLVIVNSIMFAKNHTQGQDNDEKNQKRIIVMEQNKKYTSIAQIIDLKDRELQQIVGMIQNNSQLYVRSIGITKAEIDSLTKDNVKQFVIKYLAHLNPKEHTYLINVIQSQLRELLKISDQQQFDIKFEQLFKTGKLNRGYTKLQAMIGSMGLETFKFSDIPILFDGVQNIGFVQHSDTGNKLGNFLQNVITSFIKPLILNLQMFDLKVNNIDPTSPVAVALYQQQQKQLEIRKNQIHRERNQYAAIMQPNQQLPLIHQQASDQLDIIRDNVSDFSGMSFNDSDEFGHADDSYNDKELQRQFNILNEESKKPNIDFNLDSSFNNIKPLNKSNSNKYSYFTNKQAHINITQPLMLQLLRSVNLMVIRQM